MTAADLAVPAAAERVPVSRFALLWLVYRYALVLLLAAVFVFPFVVMVTTAFKVSDEIFRAPPELHGDRHAERIDQGQQAQPERTPQNDRGDLGRPPEQHARQRRHGKWRAALRLKSRRGRRRVHVRWESRQ